MVSNFFSKSKRKVKKSKKSKESPAPPFKILKKGMLSVRHCAIISIIYALNSEKVRSLSFSIDFYFFWRRIFFTFFFTFSSWIFTFPFYFSEIKKKREVVFAIEITVRLRYAYGTHTRNHGRPSWMTQERQIRSNDAKIMKKIAFRNDRFFRKIMKITHFTP